MYHMVENHAAPFEMPNWFHQLLPVLVKWTEPLDRGNKMDVFVRMLIFQKHLTEHVLGGIPQWSVLGPLVHK